MTQEELFARFPEMTPVKSAPSMFLLNGCGVSVYGHRDRDAETGTYVKTQCIALIFVPVLALSAYRVADDKRGGWYFLGRVPVSGFAKIWNLCIAGLLACILSLGWLDHYTNTPEYKAEQALTEADALRDAGDLKKAAQSYAGLSFGDTPSAAPAQKHLKELLKEDLAKAPLPIATGVLQVVVNDARTTRLDPGLYDRMLAVVKRLQEKDPVGALGLLDLIKPLVKDASAHHALRAPLLERAVAADPQNVALVCQVASGCEERGESERCVKLLEPVRAKLGITEGARILGQMYARQDRSEDSYRLLMPYTEGRLKRLHDAEKSYDRVLKNTEKAALNQLNNGLGPSAFYRDYKKANKADQGRMVDEFILGKIKASKQVEGALKNLQREAEVVPVALDLGIVRLRRAQDISDPALRKKELEGAEKVFLDIQGVAGETDEFRLFTGQIKYWLGKQDEGMALFDQFLESKKRDAKSLLTVCRLMREVGEDGLARDMAEEAYGKTKDKALQTDAAHTRAILCKDLDDNILWLDRCDASAPDIQASLASARGRKALLDGRKDEAAREARAAMQIHLSMPRSYVTLNNAAIECRFLYSVTGDPADFAKSIDLMEQACALAPKNSILLNNFCAQLEEGVAVDVLAEALDWKALDERPSGDLLDLLYQDEAGREAWRQKWDAHPYSARVRRYREKLMVLAPKLVENYAKLASDYLFVKNVAALHALQRRTLEQHFNTGDILQEMLDYYAGRKDEQKRKSTTRMLEKYEKIIAGRSDGKADCIRGLACCLWAGTQLDALDLDMPVDLDQVIRRLEQADAEAPCVRAKRQLAMALLERAAAQVGQGQKALAEMLREGRRAHSTGDILGLAAQNDPAIRDALVRHPDFKRAMEIRKALRQALPDHRSGWEWALLRDANPTEAQAVARIMHEDACTRLAEEIQLHLYPFATRVVLDRYWSLQAEGKADEARKALASLAQQGLPVPVAP